jgi:hypothetical protein
MSENDRDKMMLANCFLTSKTLILLLIESQNLIVSCSVITEFLGFGVLSDISAVVSIMEQNKLSGPFQLNSRSAHEQEAI